MAYTYDVLGNRTIATATEANGAVTTTSYTYSSTRPHQLLAASSTGASSATATFAYDAAGHQSTRTTNGSKVDLTWDAEGELTSVGTDTSAVYDANGDRLIRVDGTGTTVYLPGGQELSINAGKVTATRYYTFAGQTVAVRTGRGLGGVASLVGDLHGTTLAAVPNTSWKKTSVIKQYTDPFGANRGTAVTVPGDRQFLDKTRDQTGLTLVGARYYDETTGRFITVDPIMDLLDPQQWNGYAYANNNPTSLSDPTGLAVSVSIEDDGGKRPSTGVNAGSPATWSTRPVAASSQSPESPEYQCTPDRAVRGMSNSEAGHLAVDVLGMAPGVGEVADALNGAWYATEGDWFGAVISGVSAVPGVGWLSTVAKWTIRGTKFTKYAEPIIKVGGVNPRAMGRNIMPDGKWDYLFGRVRSSPKNQARSIQLWQEFARIGVYDNAFGRELLLRHFDLVVARSDNISKTFVKTVKGKQVVQQVRESVFFGPGGIIKLESTWVVRHDGLQFSTVIPDGKGPYK